MANEDKRIAPRVTYPCDVECFGVGVHALNPRIADISVTGAFIDTMTELPAGTRVKLSFTLGETPLHVEAEVAHAMPQIGMGVRFVSLTNQQLARLAAFVRQHSAS